MNLNIYNLCKTLVNVVATFPVSSLFHKLHVF